MRLPDGRLRSVRPPDVSSNASTALRRSSGSGILKSRTERRPVEFADAAQGPEGVEPPERMRALQRLPQLPNDLLRRIRRELLDEETLRGQPPPPVRVGERVEEFAGARAVVAAEVGVPGRQSGGRHDPVDAAPVVALVEVEFRLHPVGDPLGVFDDAAVHVQDVQRSLRPHRQVDRSEQRVGRGEELHARPGPRRLGRGARRVDDGAMDQVRGRIRHEHADPLLPRIDSGSAQAGSVAAQAGSDFAQADSGSARGGSAFAKARAVERAAGVRRHRAGRREAARLLGVVRPRLPRADREQFGRAAIRRRRQTLPAVLPGRRQAVQVTARNDDLAQVVQVVGAEGAAPGAEGHAEAAGAAARPLEAATAEVDAEVVLADVRGLVRRVRPEDARAVAAVDAVDPVVQAVAERVHVVLRIALGKAAQQHVAPVRPTVAVRVLEVEDVRRRRRQQSPPPGQDRIRHAEIVREQPATVPSSVAVAVREFDDPRRPLHIRVAGKFEHEDAPAFVEGEVDRIDDDRLGRREFEPERRMEFEARRHAIERRPAAGGEHHRGGRERNEGAAGPTAIRACRCREALQAAGARDRGQRRARWRFGNAVAARHFK